MHKTSGFAFGCTTAIGKERCFKHELKGASPQRLPTEREMTDIHKPVYLERPPWFATWGKLL